MKASRAHPFHPQYSAGKILVPDMLLCGISLGGLSYGSGGTTHSSSGDENSFTALLAALSKNTLYQLPDCGKAPKE